MQQESIDEVKERLHVFSAENPEKIATIEEIHSDFVQEYLSFFGISEHWNRPDNQCLQALRQHNILYDPQQYFCTIPLISLANHSPNYEFLTVSIQFGLFTFHDITIANNSFAFPIKLAAYEGWGNFGKVFKIAFQEWELALKVCFLSKSQSVKADLDDLSHKLQSVLKEYCMSKLASALGVGPRICSQMGFDIIIYKDCVGYPMEYCQNEKYDTNFVQSQADLKQKLLRMHSFQFLHLDIKDDNICYSKKKKEFVFIDFGLSTIVPERLGHKSYTMYQGTANYCSPEMAKLITKEDGGYVDLYHNDKCCLEKVLNPEGNDWKANQQPINLDYLYQNQDVSWNGYDSFQKSIMPSYLKYLAYKLKFGQFQQTLSAYKGKIKNTDIGNVCNFIRGSNFSNKSIISTSRLMITLGQFLTQTDGSSVSYLSSQEEEVLYQPVYNIVSDLKSIQSKKKNKNLLNSLRDRQLLLNIEEIMRLDYKIYFRLLLEVIQINVKSCTYEQRLKYCQVARVVFKRVPRKSMVAICELVDYIFRRRQPVPDDLETVSLILFCYSLQGKIDATKIAIFHSIIYNVVLLQILDLQALLSFYRKLQCLSLEFRKKMRMILKFKTTLHWKYFEIGCSFNDRVKLVLHIKDLDLCFEQQQYGFLSQKQMRFLKFVNLECLLKSTHSNIRRLKSGLQQLADGVYSQFLVENQFQKQIEMWYLCNLMCRGLLSQRQAQGKVASEIFMRLQRREKTIQYYHLVFIIYRLRMKEGSSLQVVELFDHIFQRTKVAGYYCMDLLRQTILFYLSNRSNYCEFLQFVLGYDISKINFYSLFGLHIREVFSLIIQDKSVNFLPSRFRKIYDKLKFLDWIKDDFELLQLAAGQRILNVLIDVVKVQFYLFRVYHLNEIQPILQPRIKNVYEYSYGKIRGFTSKKCMNNALLMLNALGAYAIFRKRLFPEAIQLMKYIYILYDNMPAQEDIDLTTKIEVYRFFLQMTYVKDVLAVIEKDDYIIIFQHYIKIVKELSLYKDLLSQQILFIEVMAFLLRANQSELPAFINRLSIQALEAPTNNQPHNYYIAMEMLFRCGHFTQLLNRASFNILGKMDDVKKNPYNAIYLFFAMYNPKMRSQKRFLQLCTSFSRMKITITREIRSCYYKYFIMHYGHKMAERKKRRLFFLDLKYDFKQWKLQNIRKIDERTLTVILSGQQMQQWMRRRAAEKFNMVTMKLKEYFLGVNQRGDEFEDEIKQSPEYYFHMQQKSLKDRQ